MKMLLIDLGNYVQIFEYYLYHSCISDLTEVDFVTFTGYISLAQADNHIGYWNDVSIELNYPVDSQILDNLGSLGHLMLYFSLIF